MGAFYVSIIFLGILLVIGSLFFIAMDKVNGKDFFKEFDRKKEEMFNLIQDSEEMIQELNKMSDYVVTIIAEKNQEYFEKVSMASTESRSGHQSNITAPSIPMPAMPAAGRTIPVMPVISVKAPEEVAGAAVSDSAASATWAAGSSAAGLSASGPSMLQPAVLKGTDSAPVFSQAATVQTIVSQLEAKEPQAQKSKEEEPAAKAEDKASNVQEAKPYKEAGREVNTQMADMSERLKENETNKSRLVLNGRRREVMQMIEQGFSNDEIADRLKIGKGEIGLIRGLSK